jgi:tetratricopeptide (TPR) repeat protein
MNPKIRKVARITGMLLLFGSSVLNGQILRDSSTLVLIRQDIDLIYNFKFNDARKLSDEIFKLYPDHPIVFLIKGMITYWENYPLLPINNAQESFKAEMQKCIEISESEVSPEFEAEYLLANICARGMLLTFYSDNDVITEVIPLAVSTYKYIRKSFDYSSACIDLNYFTGLYNYYREAYTREYPVYRSIAVLFPPGNIEVGLNQVKFSSKKAVVLRPESEYLLTWIYTNFENNFKEGFIYSKSLYDKYPSNALYLSTYLKSLLLLYQYNKAESLISESKQPENEYFETQKYIFSAIIQEKKYNNYQAAEELYNKGINNLSQFGEYSNEYAAYGYYGLSRIYEAKGDKQEAKIYLKQAQKLAEFKKINFDK